MADWNLLFNKTNEKYEPTTKINIPTNTSRTDRNNGVAAAIVMIVQNIVVATSIKDRWIISS